MSDSDKCPGAGVSHVIPYFPSSLLIIFFFYILLLRLGRGWVIPSARKTTNMEVRKLSMIMLLPLEERTPVIVISCSAAYSHSIYFLQHLKISAGYSANQHFRHLSLAHSLKWLVLPLTYPGSPDYHRGSNISSSLMIMKACFESSI